MSSKGKGSPGLLIVAIVVLVIGIPLIIAAIWIGMSGMFTDPEPDNVMVHFVNPAVTQREIANETYWDVSLEVSRIHDKPEWMSWSDIKVMVRSSDGMVLNTRTRPLDLDPRMYDDGTDGHVDVQFWFHPTIPGDLLLSVGDTLMVSGMSLDYEGAMVEVFYRDNWVADFALPSNFP